MTLEYQPFLARRHKRYAWISERQGRMFLVTMNDPSRDVCIERFDITGYDVPRLEKAALSIHPVERLRAHHSTEGDILVAIMKYVKQANIPSIITSPTFVAEMRERERYHKLPKYLGDMEDAERKLVPFSHPLPVIDLSTPQNSPYWFFGGPGHQVESYIDSEGSLAFSLHGIDTPKHITYTIHPAEVDDHIKGLFLRCPPGEMRTPQILLDIIAYSQWPTFIEKQHVQEGAAQHLRTKPF